MSREERQASRYRNLGHWATFYAALVGTGRTPALAVALADEALAELLSAVPQLTQPAPIEPHGAPEFPTEQPSEAAPDGPFVNEESASSPRQHPAAISKRVPFATHSQQFISNLIAAAAEARDYLDGCSDLLDGMGSEAGCGNVWRALNGALKPFVDDDITQPDTAVS